MYQSIRYLFLLVFICFIAMSFQKDERPLTIQELIDQEIAKEMEVYKKIKKRKCREKILLQANLTVDSILITQAKIAKMADTLNRPSKPIKPIKPEIIIPQDTSPIAPLLEVENE